MFKEFLENLDFSFTGGINVESCLDSHVGNGWKIRTDKHGGKIVFSGNKGQIGDSKWSDKKNLIIPVYFEKTHSFYFHINFIGENNVNTDIAMGVLPFIKVNIVIPLSALKLETLFLPRTPGRLKNTSTGTPQKPENIVKFEFCIPESSTQGELFIGKMYLTDEFPDEKVVCEPQMDIFGQWTVKDWEGKIKNEDELKSIINGFFNEKLPDLDIKTSQYGGDLSKKFGSNGYFSTLFKDEKWWLVDPDGYAFYSIGSDCVRTEDDTPVKGIEQLFSWLPDENDPVFAQSWSNRHGNKAMNFPISNLIRVFGEKWHENWEKITAKRMKSWGFNTIANWSEYELGQKYNIPYVIETPFPSTETTLFRDFPDVFSDEYKQNAEKCALFLEKFKNDKFLIGYFLRNEPNWGFGAYNIAGMMLEKPNMFASKIEFIKHIKNKYNNDINAFCEAWQIKLNSFDELENPIEKAWENSEIAEKDLFEFTEILITEYIKIPSLACKKIDPNHLNLGMRWAWIASDAFFAGSEYLDVFSINCYQLKPNTAEIAKITEKTGLPVMIGEFHAGALDVGLPANALVGVKTQADRGKFYSYYVENGAVIPQLIGMHYFKWSDQVASGRFDGENLNIGLIDVCGQPYTPMIECVRTTNAIVTTIHAGEKEPTKVMAESAPREGF